MAKRTDTTSFRIPSDLVEMAGIVAKFQKRAAVEVFDDIVRGPLTKMYADELMKAAKVAESQSKPKKG